MVEGTQSTSFGEIWTGAPRAGSSEANWARGCGAVSAIDYGCPLQEATQVRGQVSKTVSEIGGAVSSNVSVVVDLARRETRAGTNRYGVSEIGGPVSNTANASPWSAEQNRERDRRGREQ